MASWLNSSLKELKNRLQRCVHFADKTDPFGPIKFFVMRVCMTNAADIYAGLSSETLVLPKDRDNGGPCEDLVDAPKRFCFQRALRLLPESGPGIASHADHLGSHLQVIVSDDGSLSTEVGLLDITR